MTGEEPPTDRRASWLDWEWSDWLCGAILLVVVYGPPITVSSLPARDKLHWHWGSLHADFGVVLATLPGLALLALVAPLVLYRRRDAFIGLLPWGWIIVWKFGARLSVLSKYGQDRQLKIVTAAATSPQKSGA
jgi:hypothetical protein